MLKQNPITGVPDGLFVAAYDQPRNPELPGYHAENLSELIDWFRKTSRNLTGLTLHRVRDTIAAIQKVSLGTKTLHMST